MIITISSNGLSFSVFESPESIEAKRVIVQIQGRESYEERELATSVTNVALVGDRALVTTGAYVNVLSPTGFVLHTSVGSPINFVKSLNDTAFLVTDLVVSAIEVNTDPICIRKVWESRTGLLQSLTVVGSELQIETDRGAFTLDPAIYSRGGS